MPQEKFITRASGRISEGSFASTAKGEKAASQAYRKIMRPAIAETARETGSYKNHDKIRLQQHEVIENTRPTAKAAATEAGRRVDAKVVTGRDATNARIMRERLANRAAQTDTGMGAKAAGGALASGLAKGLGVAGVLAASEKAAGETPTQLRSMMQNTMNDPKSWYNTQGPGSVKRPSYNGQSTMSKLMDVKNPKR